MPVISQESLPFSVIAREFVGKEQPHAFVNTGDGPLRQVDIHVSPHFATEWLTG
jgi:hypothetical protein